MTSKLNFQIIWLFRGLKSTYTRLESARSRHRVHLITCTIRSSGPPIHRKSPPSNLLFGIFNLKVKAFKLNEKEAFFLRLVNSFEVYILCLITAKRMYHLCHLFYHQMTRNVPINATPFTSTSDIINAHTSECDILYRRYFYDSVS